MVNADRESQPRISEDAQAMDILDQVSAAIESISAAIEYCEHLRLDSTAAQLSQSLDCLKHELASEQWRRINEDLNWTQLDALVDEVFGAHQISVA